MNVLFLAYAALPAFAANVFPVLAARWGWLGSLAVPVHKRWLGDNKTWRGFVVGILAGMAIAIIQYVFGAPYLPTLMTAALFGMAGGCGALLGDAAKSFVKRRLGIGPGKPFVPFDYIDYMIGFLISTYAWYPWSWHEALLLITMALILNPLSNLVGYKLGIKNTYW
jgi:CDP-2,3-bis-(O-geranylgeranyl)-sn-glycerol synthase